MANTTTNPLRNPKPKGLKKLKDWDPRQNFVPAPNGQKVIYFLGRSDEEVIKIGISDTLELARGRQVEHTRNAAPHIDHDFDTLLCLLYGSTLVETDLLDYFGRKGLRIADSEFIRATKEVKEYICWLLKYAPVSRSFDNAPGWVEPSTWMPSEDKRNPIPIPELYSGSKPWDTILSILKDDDDYISPVELVECARRTMGGLDLDPASSFKANLENVCAPRFYGPYDNGLVQNWYGRVWLNPPLDAWDEWADKILEEIAAGRMQQICFYIHATGLATNYGTRLVPKITAMVPLAERVQFEGRKATSKPTTGGLIVYWGPRSNIKQFKEAFRDLAGAAFIPWEDQS